MTDPLIRCEGLTKVFVHSTQTVLALKEVHLALYPGEFVCLAGRSGSGKTTLLHCIGTLENSTSGKIWIGGKALESIGEGQLLGIRQAYFGFIFQQFFLFPYLSALDNVAVPLVYRGASWEKARQKARVFLEETDLSHKALQLAKWLSGGEAQRVALARALIHDPKILLADEPTGELDSVTSLQMAELLDKQRKKGVTLLVATHDERIMEKATRVIRLEDGKIQ